jgi:hypothetical protein
VQKPPSVQQPKSCPRRAPCEEQAVHWIRGGVAVYRPPRLLSVLKPTTAITALVSTQPLAAARNQVEIYRKHLKASMPRCQNPSASLNRPALPVKPLTDHKDQHFNQCIPPPPPYPKSPRVFDSLLLRSETMREKLVTTPLVAADRLSGKYAGTEECVWLVG